MYKLLYMGKVYLYIYNILILITGVQDSGVIIDRLLRQCCFVRSEIVGPHSSGNFNDSIIYNIFIIYLTPVYLTPGSKSVVVPIRPDRKIHTRFQTWGPFLESPGDFSGPKSNILNEI